MRKDDRVHYTCYVRARSNRAQWLRYDDTKSTKPVRTATPATAENARENASLIFYRR